MDQGPTILLIDEDPAAVDSIRRVLGDQASFKLRRVADVPTGVARIRGGGIDVALLNLPASHGAENPLATFLALQEKASGLPVVILCDAPSEGLARTAVQQGAAAYVLREAAAADLPRILRSVARKTASAAAPQRPLATTENAGKIFAFMGAKGGVGTTTVALNVAAALASHRRVILAELHTELGSLPLYFQPHRSARDIGDLLAGLHGPQEVPRRELESCLWPVRNVPGLNILFSSRNHENSISLDAANVAVILALASEIADYVIVDLPASLSATNRAVLESSACLALVVEREPISVQSARMILDHMDAWNTAKLTIGAVILNRAALVSPMPFTEIAAELRVATLGVIPPATDLCAAAQHARAPMVMLDTESLASMAMLDLSREMAELIPSAHTSERVEDGPVAAYHIGQKMTRAGVR